MLVDCCLQHTLHYSNQNTGGKGKGEGEGGDEVGGNATVPISYYHPSSSTDASYFLPLPFDSDLRRIVWVMNKMLPPDVRILDASPTPDDYILPSHDAPPFRTIDPRQRGKDDGPDDGKRDRGRGDGTRPFHPSLDTEAKTYRHTFSLGQFHNPTRCR